MASIKFTHSRCIVNIAPMFCATGSLFGQGLSNVLTNNKLYSSILSYCVEHREDIDGFGVKLANTSSQ